MAETYRYGKTMEEYWDKAFLNPAISLLDTVGSGRWKWWNRQLLNGKVEKEIPKINWGYSGEKGKVMKLLTACCEDYACQYTDFLDFILFGLGYSRNQQWLKIPCRTVKIWEECLQEALPLMMRHPYPYFTDLLEQEMGRRTKQGTGFFATPINVSDMMAAMSYGDIGDPTKSVADMCCGTANLLLAASNYSVNLYGQDINQTVLMGAQIHAHLYMPWMAMPMPSLMQCPPFMCGNSLWPEEMRPLPYYVYERTAEKAV